MFSHLRPSDFPLCAISGSEDVRQYFKQYFSVQVFCAYNNLVTKASVVLDFCSFEGLVCLTDCHCIQLEGICPDTLELSFSPLADELGFRFLGAPIGFEGVRQAVAFIQTRVDALQGDQAIKGTSTFPSHSFAWLAHLIRVLETDIGQSTGTQDSCALPLQTRIRQELVRRFIPANASSLRGQCGALPPSAPLQ